MLLEQLAFTAPMRRFRLRRRLPELCDLDALMLVDEDAEVWASDYLAADPGAACPAPDLRFEASINVPLQGEAHVARRVMLDPPLERTDVRPDSVGLAASSSHGSVEDAEASRPGPPLWIVVGVA